MEPIDRLKSYLPPQLLAQYSDEKLQLILDMAAALVLNRLYPFRTGRGTDLTIPDEYAFFQIRVALEIAEKEGAQGQTSHSENTLSRSYEAGDISRTLLSEITPEATVGG